MKLLIVLTTHDKYVDNGYLTRCQESWKNNLKLDKSDTVEYYIVNDSTRLHLGVTQSRIEGYIYAREHKFDWVTFCDADAYVAEEIQMKPLSVYSELDCAMVSCHYGYKSDKGSNIVDPLKEMCYKGLEFGKRVFSWVSDKRDYPVFMGRFFNMKYLSADMFVDTKMYGDDGTFFLLFCDYNKDRDFAKIKGKVESTVESDKSLPLINVQVGEELIKWTLKNAKYLNKELRDKFVFQKLIIAYFQYIFFLYGYISEEHWNHGIKFNWDYGVELNHLDQSQLSFMSEVQSAEEATMFMKKRYSEL